MAVSVAVLPRTAVEATAVEATAVAVTGTRLAPVVNPPGGKFIGQQQWVSSLSTLIHDKL